MNAAPHIRARDDLSVDERDALVREVQRRVLDTAEFATVYSRSGAAFRVQVAEERPSTRVPDKETINRE